MGGEGSRVGRAATVGLGGDEACTPRLPPTSRPSTRTMATSGWTRGQREFMRTPQLYRLPVAAHVDVEYQADPGKAREHGRAAVGDERQWDPGDGCDAHRHA